MTPDIFAIGQFSHRRMIAVFDYDWTLVKPKTGFIYPENK